MRRALGNIIGFRLAAADGEIGKVHDFLIDDDQWKLRYLVVETGKWLRKQQVLIAPGSVAGVDPAKRKLVATLTRKEVQTSVSADTEKPISQQREAQFASYQAWDPNAMVLLEPVPSPVPPNEIPGDPHLRSFREITFYGLVHRGESIAQVRDFVMDASDTSIPLLVVKYGSWFHQRIVELPIEAVSEISWLDRAITTGLTQADLDRIGLKKPWRDPLAQ